MESFGPGGAPVVGFGRVERRGANPPGDGHSGRSVRFAAQGDDPRSMPASADPSSTGAELRPFLNEQPALLEPIAAPVRRFHLVATVCASAVSATSAENRCSRQLNRGMSTGSHVRSRHRGHAPH